MIRPETGSSVMEIGIGEMAYSEPQHSFTNRDAGRSTQADWIGLCTRAAGSGIAAGHSQSGSGQRGRYNIKYNRIEKFTRPIDIFILYIFTQTNSCCIFSIIL